MNADTLLTLIMCGYVFVAAGLFGWIARRYYVPPRMHS